MIDSVTLRGNFLNEVQELVVKKDWRRIVDLSKKYELAVTSEFLWTFPTEYCLHFLKALWKSFHITNVLSIGCGSGLLEFVMRESMGSYFLLSLNLHVSKILSLVRNNGWSI